MALPPFKIDDWKFSGAEKRQKLRSKIPKTHILQEELIQRRLLPNDSAIISCGILTDLDVEITSIDDAAILLARVAQRKYTAVQVADAYCKRASIAQQTVNCLTEILHDDAMKRARELDTYPEVNGETVGILHGLPVSLKDLFGVKNVHATAGLVSWIPNVSAEHCSITKGILAAGGILYTKTIVSQGHLMVESINNVFGTTANPYNCELSAGRSSGGEAALLAAKGAILGSATDGGGSIRLPAAFCGLRGLKCSKGRMPTMGIESPGDGNESTNAGLGPLARSVSGCELWLRAQLDTEPWNFDFTCIPMPYNIAKAARPVSRLVIGVIRDDGVVRPTPPVSRALESVITMLTAAGHSIYMDVGCKRHAHRWMDRCMLAGEMTSRLGRKMTIIGICVVALFGMMIQAAVLNYWALMVGRLINAFSMGIEANCVPMYMAELAPASIRGGLINFYQSWLYVGAIFAALTVYGTPVTPEGMWTYRTAIVVQLAPPCMLLTAVWFIPESPRWLLGKGRLDEALKALAFMRYGSSMKARVVEELNLIDLAMQEEKELHRATSYMDCFKGTNRRRTIIAIGVQVLQQAQGNSFTTTYLVLFLQQVGVNEPLLINVAKMCCNFGATLLTYFLSDMLGRRPMLMGGSFFMAGLIWTVSGVSSFTVGELSNPAAQGVVAAILLYIAGQGRVNGHLGRFRSILLGLSHRAVTAEVSTSQLRERTTAIATVCGFITSLLITYINPFVQNEPGNLGPKVGMIYGSISVIALVFVFVVVPEMKGRSLEELDELFRANVPAWKAKSYVCTGIGTRITDIQWLNEKIVMVEDEQTIDKEVADQGKKG